MHFFANLIETFLKYAFGGNGDVFKAEGIMVTHKDADHVEGVQRLFDKFPPNQDPSPGKAKFEFKGPLLCSASTFQSLKSIKFQEKSPFDSGDTIEGFENIFAFYYPNDSGVLGSRNKVNLYYYTPSTTPTTELCVAPHAPHLPRVGGPGDKYNPDTSRANQSSILLNIADPVNPSDMLFSLNGDSVGNSILQALQGKNPTVFKVPHHGSRYNSLPLEAYIPDALKQTKQLLATHALLQLTQVPSPAPADLVVTYQITAGNKLSFENKFKEILQDFGPAAKKARIALKKGLKYDDMLLQLATHFQNQLVARGIIVANLLDILQKRKKQIDDNLKDSSLDSTKVYTNGMESLSLPAHFDYLAAKKAVLKDAESRDKDIKEELGTIPAGANLPYKESKAYQELFNYLETDRMFQDNISLHLITAFYQEIKARTFFISSGDQHKYPHWQVVSGIIQAAQIARKNAPTYTCRLLLTSGNGIDENMLPNNTTDDWTEYVSLQYFCGETASVVIDPKLDPMQLLDGAVEWKKGIPLPKSDLLKKYNSTAGAFELKKLRTAALYKQYVVKPTGQNYWLDFDINATTNAVSFKLASVSTTFTLTNTAFALAVIDKKELLEIVFTLTLEKYQRSPGPKKVAVIFGIIGSHVPESGSVSYKLFQKVLTTAGVEEWQYFYVSAGKLATSTKQTDGSYFVFQDPSKSFLSVRPLIPAYSTVSACTLSNYIIKVGAPPNMEKTANAILRLLLSEPYTANIPQSLQAAFFTKALNNWEVNDSSTITSTSASLVLEVPTSGDTIYSLVITSATLEVAISEKRIDAIIEASGDGGILTLRMTKMCWTQDIASGRLTFIKDKTPEDHGLIATPMTRFTTPSGSSTLSLAEFLKWIDYSGDSKSVSSQTVLDLTVAKQVTQQLLSSGKLSEGSTLYKYIKAMLSWNVNSSSTFVVLNNSILSANISLIQPSNPQKFKDYSVSSTSILIQNPKTNRLSMGLQLDATDSDGLQLKLIFSLDKLINEFVQAFQDYLKAIGVKDVPSSYDLFDSVMFLLGSETDGFLSLASFTRALVSMVLEWKVALKTSVVSYVTSPLGPKLLEATLAASIPDKGNTMDLGISKVVKLKQLAFNFPNVFQEEITAPNITADVTVGDKSARITAVAPQGAELPSLKVELTQSISLNDIVSFLGLSSSIANAHIPLLSKALNETQITTAGFTIQQKVTNSRQSWLSSVFFAVKFSNVGSYLPSAFSSLKDIEAQVVVYQPLLSLRKISINVRFNFAVPVQGSDGKTENVNFGAILSAEPVQVTNQAESSYNFTVAIKFPSNNVDPSEGLSLSAILTAFGLRAAVSSAESIPFIKSLLKNVVLRELIVTFNTGSKTIQSFLLKVYIPSWKLFYNKVELSEFEINLSYNNGDWATIFEGNAVFEEEFPITIQFDLVTDVNKEASFAFSNSNHDFTIQQFLSVFGLGSLGSIPVLGQVLSIAVTDAKLTLQKNDSGVIATEGQVSLYKESINLGSVFRLSQVSATIGFVRTEKSNYVFGFSVEGFVNKKIYLSVKYDPNTQILSGQAVIASFQKANLNDAVGAFIPSNELSKNSVYMSVSNSFTAALSVAFERKSGDFSLKNLIIDLRHVFSIGPINLEQLRFEYSKTDTTDYSGGKLLLPAGSQVKLIGVLTGKPDKKFSAIVEFDLSKDTTGASTITASIRPAKENTLTLLSFLSLFSITPPAIPSIEGQDTPKFFDLALKEGSVVLSLPDYSVTSLHIKVETTNSVNLLDSPQITLENLSFEVNYSKSASPTTTGSLLGVITLVGIKIAIEGSKEKDGTVFKAAVGPESADLRKFIKSLTPADTTSPTIPSDVGLPKPMLVHLAALTVGLLKDKRTITFQGASQLKWNIDLGFTNFQILELGGLVNYIKLRTRDKSSEFSVYVTGKFKFSSSIQMETELHFGVNVDTVLAVLITGASHVKVDSVADDLLKFNQPKPPALPSYSDSPPPPGAIAFKDLLPTSTSSLVDLTSAYINLNLSQSVFLLLGQVASLGTGFLLAGKFSKEQTGYGYAFGISLPKGFRFSQLLSALSPIDDIVQVRKATCVVMSMENAKVKDVVEKMKAAQKATILPKDAGGFVFPFSDLQLDDATKNLTITRGMSFYAEFDIPALGSDSIFHSIIQISSSPDVPAVIISAIISKDPTQSEFRAHLEKLTLLGLLEFKGVTLIYHAKSLTTLELHGTVTILLGDTCYSFYGLFNLTKMEAVFSVTTDPSKQITIHEPLGMFGISLEEARLTLKYNFPENKPKTSSMEIAASVNFYSSGSSDDDNVKPLSVLTLCGLIAFRKYIPVVVSVTITPTKPLTIADFVATIFKWKYNLDFLNIGFVNGRIYYAKLPDGEESIKIDDVEYTSGYHISADTEIFNVVFTIEANIPLDKSQVSITGYAHKPIDLGFAKFTGKKDSDPSQPDENKSPQLTFTTCSSSTSISIGIGLILFEVPLATADIGYNLKKKVFIGKLTYSGSLGFIHNPSISFEWSKQSGFKVTSFPMSGAFDFNFLDKLKNFKDSCGSLVGLAFKQAVQTKFNINTHIAKTTHPDDFLAEIQISGTYDVLLAGKAKIASVPLPDLSVGIPREDNFSLHNLPQFILDLFTKNANTIVQQIIDDPKRLAAILAIIVLKSVTKKIIKSLICRGMDGKDFEDHDPTDDEGDNANENEGEFDGFEGEFGSALAAGEMAAAGAAAAAAEGAADVALGILAGIIGFIAAILAFFSIASFKEKEKKGKKQKANLEKKKREMIEKMEAALDIKQAPSATFTPPNQLKVSWNSIGKSGVQYHLKVTGSLLPPPGSNASITVTIYDKVVSHTEQLITNEQLYNAIAIYVTVNATLTATKKGHTSTFNGKSYTVEVPNVHPTLHPPAQVSATYEHDKLKIIATASSVEHALAYHFQLIEGTTEPYKVISQCTYTVAKELESLSLMSTSNISVKFDHSCIPSDSKGPFKVRCQAVGESNSGIATSAYTYSTALSLVPPLKDLTLVLSHFEDPKQDIAFNWKVPQSTDQDTISGCLCRIVHKESNTVLESYDVKKHAPEEGQPPPDIPTTHYFTIDSVVQALLSHKLIPDPPASVKLEAQVNAVGISSAQIDSVFIKSTINSLESPEKVEFVVETNVLRISWIFTQETSTYGIEIIDERPEVLFSKKVTVNKDNSKPQGSSQPDSDDHKVTYGIQYSELSAISDPTVNYTVQVASVTVGNEDLDSLVPGKASNSLRKLPTPTATKQGLQFNADTRNVDAEFNSVPNAWAYLFQLWNDSKVLARVTIPKPTTHGDSPSESVIKGSLSINSFIDQLTKGDQVYGTVQAFGGGDFLSSFSLKFTNGLTVLQPPSNIKYSFSPKEETITIACSQVEKVSEYLLGLLNPKGSDMVSMKCTAADKKEVSVTLSINNLNKSDVEEWKVFAQSLGNATHLSSPHSFLENKVHVLPKPVVQQPFFDTNYDVLTVSWPTGVHVVSYSLTIAAMKGDHKLFSTSKATPALGDVTNVVVIMNESCSEWDSILEDLTSLTGTVVAIGADYYISSSPSLMPTIERFDPPQNLKYGYDSDSDLITLTCDAAAEVSKCKLGMKSVKNPDTAISKTEADKNDQGQVSVSLSAKDLRDANAGNEWMIFGESSGDSSHFPSTETTLNRNVKVLDLPVFNSFTYSASNQILNLDWSLVKGASKYSFIINYRNIKGQDKSFEAFSPQNKTSLQIDMNQAVQNWSTVFETVASIVATIKAVGSGYYITSSMQSSPTLERLTTPRNVKITSDDKNVTITWSTVPSSAGYTVVVKVNGKLSLSKAVKENKIVIPLDDLIKHSGSSRMSHIRVEITADSKGYQLPSFPGIAEKDIQVKKLHKSQQFGGHGGVAFDDQVECHEPSIVGIKAIKTSAEVYKVHSIQMTYLLADGTTYVAPQHGVKHGHEKYIEFDAGEEIVMVAGKIFRSQHVAMLVFVTKTANGIEKKYVFAGAHSGIPFRVSGKILGIFGRCGYLLNSVGFYMTSIPTNILTSPLHGGSGGAYFNDPISTHSPQIAGIRVLRICHGRAVESIQATYALEDGAEWLAPQHGGRGGSECNTIYLDAGELIKKVDGFAEGKFLYQLTITTETAFGKEKKYGPYGMTRKTNFSVNGRVIGVLGRSSNILDAIGFYYTQLPPKAIVASNCFGGNGGDAFSDDVPTHKPEIIGIRAIRISYGDQVNSIQATYRCADGSTWVAPMHGTHGGRESYVQFADNERMQAIVGETDNVLVDQLKFYTLKCDGTQGSYGPFGSVRTGMTSFRLIYFNFLGLLGRAKNHLDSIGVYYLK